MDLFGGSARDDDSRARRVPVSSVVIRRLWAQRRTDPTIGACCAHIVSRVIGSGFSFASLSGREPSREFTRHVETHVVPFAKTALDALLVQGYVVFDVRRRIRRAPFPVPFVCSERAYDAQVVLDDQLLRRCHRGCLMVARAGATGRGAAGCWKKRVSRLAFRQRSGEGVESPTSNPTQRNTTLHYTDTRVRRKTRTT